MAIIEKPINVFTIANQLGYYEYAPHPVTGQTVRKVDVGRLCTHPSINMWSKYKPVDFNKLTELLPSEFASTNFGLTPPTPTTNYVTAVNQKWSYRRPQGGSTSPFRVADFNNYNSNAGEVASVMGDIEINTSNITSRPIALMMNVSGGETLIGINDFVGEIGSYYYGVVFESGTTYNTKHIKTATSTISEGGNTFDVLMNEPPFSTLQLNPIKLYHVLVNESVPSMTSLGNVTRNFLSIPSDGENISEITTKTGADFAMNFKQVGTVAGGAMQDIDTYIGIDAPFFMTGGNIFFRVELVNSYTESRTFAITNLKISVNPTFFGDSFTADSILLNSSGTPVTSVNVGAGQTVSVYVGANNLLNRSNGAIATPQQGTEIYSMIKLMRGNDRLTEVSFKIKSI